MQNWKQVLPAVLVAVLAGSIIFKEAGFSGEAAGNLLNAVRGMLEPLLFVAAAILAWRQYQKLGTSFGMWLAAALTVVAVLGVEDLLFRNLFDFSALSLHSLQLVQFLYLINSALQQAGGIIFVLLLVYAAAHYSGRDDGTPVFAKKWLVLLGILMLYYMIVQVPGITSRLGEYNIPLMAAVICLGAASIALYVYGLEIVQQKLKSFNHTALRWLAVFCAGEIIYHALLLVNTLVSLSFILGRPVQLPLIYLFNWIPVILAVVILLVAVNLREEGEGRQ